MNMNFGEALLRMKTGQRVCRSTWVRMSLGLVDGVMHLKTAVHDVPWVPNQQDLLADDWQVIGE